MNYILSHDIGTTGIKSCLFTEGLKLVGYRYRLYQTFYPGPLMAVQRPDDWWEAIVKSTREIMEETEINPDSVAVICLDGHMNGCVPLDAHGNLLMDEVFLWADFRSTEEAAYIESEVGFEQFYNLTGGGLDLAIYPAAKILWLKKHMDSVYRNTSAFIGTKDFINYKLTGTIATDYSDGSNYGLLDIRKTCWSKEILNALDLDISKLPQILHSTEVVGFLKKDVANECGLVSGIPVVTGGGDVPCASVGAGSYREGVPYINIGSASWVSKTVTKQSLQFDYVNRPFLLHHVIEDLYCTQLVNYGGGICYQWIIDTLAAMDTSENIDSIKDKLYKSVEEQYGIEQDLSNNLIFLPYIRGGGAPDFNEKARGAFIGLSMEHDGFAIINAVQEGVAYNIRRMLPLIFKNESLPSELRIIGGGARSDAWCRIIADICSATIYRPEMLQTATAKGAAILGGVGTGIFPDFSVAETNVVDFSIFKPELNKAAYHDRKYNIFLDLITSLNPYYNRLLE